MLLDPVGWELIDESIDMNSELIAIDQPVYGSRELMCDLDAIRLVRKPIAQILQKYPVSLESK